MYHGKLYGSHCFYANSWEIEFKILQIGVDQVICVDGEGGRPSGMQI